MEVEDAIWFLAQQARAQDICEQVVVSVPLATCVEWDHEEIAAFEDLERGLTSILARDRVAQGTGQPVEDGGPLQEPTDVVGLSLEHFLDEVIHDEAIVAGEARDEARNIVSALQ